MNRQELTALLAEVVGGEEKLFLNRDLSWLQFNGRVLHEAVDERTPLLERVAFLAIFTSNLDEFFQKRVGCLKRQLESGGANRTPDGLTAAELLAAIRTTVLQQLSAQAELYEQTIKPSLAAEGVELLQWNQLTDSEREYATHYFHANLFPVLTPLSVDPGHPFPFISNLSTSLGVILRYPGEQVDPGGTGESEMHFARVKVPRILPRWLNVSTGDTAGKLRLVHLEDIIREHLSHLFEGMIIEDVMPFRITRNADVESDEDDAEDLLDMVEQELRDRRFASVIRLEVPVGANPRMTRFLTEELNLDAHDVYYMPSEMDFTDFWMVHGLGSPRLKYRPWSPVLPPRLQDDEADIFNVIRAGDLLVHHPYESFAASVERFIRAAANDPKVVALKLTLYRTSEASPFIPQLIRAAEAGKQVACLVELKARFDEERNVQLAQQLEKAGVHVVYGVVGLKTHTKTALVVRHEQEGMRTYVHIGTGNYNSKTAQVYTDLGLFTCRPEITGDLVQLFHYLTGRSLKSDFSSLLVAPINMKKRFYQLIEREIADTEAWRQRGGDPDDPLRPRIVAKMNSLEDRGVCRKLYEASRAGVAINLIVRGFCCLRPGVPGLSDHITVTSVIGRFLEHSRIFMFHNQGNREYYIGSADWMYRNLNNRVECITPILDPALQSRLQLILDVMLRDRRQAWDMHGDGNYTQRHPDPQVAADAGENLGTHQILMELARREAQRAGGG